MARLLSLPRTMGHRNPHHPIKPHPEAMRHPLDKVTMKGFSHNSGKHGNNVEQADLRDSFTIVGRSEPSRRTKRWQRGAQGHGGSLLRGWRGTHKEPMIFETPYRGEMHPKQRNPKKQKEPKGEPINAENKNGHPKDGRKCLI